MRPRGVLGVDPSRRNPSYPRIRTWCTRANAPFDRDDATWRDAMRYAMRRIVIVFYWRRAVLARLSRVSLASPMSKAAIPATSASGAVRRAACRKWIHRCRVLINQISTTISQQSCDELSSSGVSLCFWFTLHSISQLISQSQGCLKCYGNHQTRTSSH